MPSEVIECTSGRYFFQPFIDMIDWFGVYNQDNVTEQQVGKMRVKEEVDERLSSSTCKLNMTDYYQYLDKRTEKITLWMVNRYELFSYKTGIL